MSLKNPQSILQSSFFQKWWGGNQMPQESNNQLRLRNTARDYPNELFSCLQEFPWDSRQGVEVNPVPILKRCSLLISSSKDTCIYSPQQLLGTHISPLESLQGDNKQLYIAFQFSSVQVFSHVQLFVTLETATCQASLYITNSRSLVGYIHQTHVH